MKSLIEHNRANWLAWLRAPGRRKHVGCLGSSRDPGARCVLGHAAHMLGAESAPTEDEKGRRMRFTHGGDAETKTLPAAMAADALGITVDGAFRREVVVDGKAYGSIMKLNDGTRLSMVEIADVLEKQFADDNMLPSDSWLEKTLPAQDDGAADKAELAEAA